MCSAAAAGLIDEALSPKTLIRYLNDPKLTDVLRTLIRESAAPLADVESRFAVDSTGFSTCNYERWFDHKWGRERSKRQWVKAHVIVGVHTNVVTDVLVTDNVGEGSGDAPQLPELVLNTAQRFAMNEVSADKAYMSRRNFDAIEAVGAVPYIPFRSGTTGEGPAMWRRMWALFMYRGEEFGLRAKSFVAQRNEVLCKILAHNLVVLVGAMYELGITAEFWGAPAQGGCDVHCASGWYSLCQSARR